MHHRSSDTGYTLHDSFSNGAVNYDRAKTFYGKSSAPGLDSMNGPSGGPGTSTASVIVGHNERSCRQPGVEGVAPDANLIPLRVTDNVVLFRKTKKRALGRALEWAANENDVDILSISLGSTTDEHYQEQLRTAVAKGVLICAAAGNSIKESFSRRLHRA